MESYRALITGLQKRKYLESVPLVNAFKDVDRADFIPLGLKQSAYIDQALPIGMGQTISQPLTVAFMLELLSPTVGETILEIGTGSGWQAALLAHIVGLKGRIVSIERIPELVSMAQGNIKKYDELSKRIEIVLGDGSQGYIKNAPYDRIIAAASASNMPEAWKEQLRIGGVLVAPIGQSILKLVKRTRSEFSVEEYSGFVFVPLISEG